MDANVNTGSADYKSGYEAGFEAQTNGQPKTYPGEFLDTAPPRYWGWHDGWTTAWKVENK